MSLILASDADSVLFDYVQGLIPFMDEKGIDNSHLKNLKGTSVHVPPSELFNLDPTTSLNLIKEFNRSSHIKNLPVFQSESIEVLKNIKKAGIDIFIVTCLGTERVGQQNRYENVKALFGDIISKEQVITLDINESKEPYLKQIKKIGNVITHIDDRLKHVYEAQSAGIKPIWYNNVDTLPDNQKHSEIIHKTCWKDIENYVLIERD